MIRADHTEPLLLAAFSARDLASAAAAVESYKRMLSPEDVTLTSDAGELCLSYAWPASVGEPPQVLVDIELAFLVEIARRARREIGLAPRRVAVRARALDPRAQHAAFFRCPIVSGAAANALYWDADDARVPFQTYNPGLLAALQPYLAAHTPAATSSTISQVRAVIAQQLRGRRPTVHSVSKDLAMSTRTLQRLLGEHGTSFRALLDEVRNQHAHGYLRATAFSDPEIAYLLGFDEPTSFYRAFRAWNGLSPSEFRRKAHPH
jgi:AraC-like DNA-binding protein